MKVITFQAAYNRAADGYDTVDLNRYGRLFDEEFSLDIVKRWFVLYKSDDDVEPQNENRVRFRSGRGGVKGLFRLGYGNSKGYSLYEGVTPDGSSFTTKTPRTIGEFVNDGLRAGIDLKWSPEAIMYLKPPKNI